jgi:hypothetical protein
MTPVYRMECWNARDNHHLEKETTIGKIILIIAQHLRTSETNLAFLLYRIL